ncbi:glycosyltransferase [Aureisphaera galaxeae]|uniref:glycosyltransferase n=1 Tax=Aureisphaera galaxeae TaxID=1538023 RepID=UPI00234FD7A6|nr:glycosyltransferase [Aureisphaera galaxeae]MDC8006288.1 glycosyltransferase [Aureisphaera galaxeae]
MKVVQVTTSSRGGAGIAALRLHKALQGIGIASAFLSRDLSIDFNGNVVQDSFFDYRKPSFWVKIQWKLKLLISPSKQERVQREIDKVKGQLTYEMLSLPFSKKELETHPYLQEADLVNLHMVTGILDYKRFFSLFKKPVVWTLHDMNPFMGLFHYQGDKERNTIIQQLDMEMLHSKKKAISQCVKGALASPSQWLLEEAEVSKVFDHFSERKTIPNSIDLSVFHPEVNTLRKTLNIGPDEKVLLFAAGALHIDRKGFALLKEALSTISFPLTLLTMGKGEVEIPNEAVKVIPLGFKSEPQEIVACYVTADACILPSKEDNLPNIMLEALATGTPVVGYAIGGLKEHIEEGKNGVLAKEVSAKALKEAIEAFFEMSHSFQKETIRTYAEVHFDSKIQAEAYRALYTKVLEP